MDAHPFEISSDWQWLDVEALGIQTRWGEDA